MKKWMLLILVLLLCLPAIAEEHPAVPVEIVEERAQNQIQVGLNEAIAKAQAEIPALPEQYQTRAEFVRMSDDTYRWVVTVFDLKTLTNGWCVEVDMSTGAVLASYTTKDGFFTDVYEKWGAHKGSVRALWSMEDKALFDALYAPQPMYGLPERSDMIADDVLAKALAALGLQNADGYIVCYGYIMGNDGNNGILEICLSVDGVSVSDRVNVDAVTGEIYYLESADNGNG